MTQAEVADRFKGIFEEEIMFLRESGMATKRIMLLQILRYDR